MYPCTGEVKLLWGHPLFLLMIKPLEDSILGDYFSSAKRILVPLISGAYIC